MWLHFYFITTCNYAYCVRYEKKFCRNFAETLILEEKRDEKKEKAGSYWSNNEDWLTNITSVQDFWKINCKKCKCKFLYEISIFYQKNIIKGYYQGIPAPSYFLFVARLETNEKYSFKYFNISTNIYVIFSVIKIANKKL